MYYYEINELNEIFREFNIPPIDGEGELEVECYTLTYDDEFASENTKN